MSLADSFPSVEASSRMDKLRPLQFMAQELADGEDDLSLVGGQSYPVWSPDF